MGPKPKNGEEKEAPRAPRAPPYRRGCLKGLPGVQISRKKSPGKLEMKKCSKFLANFLMSTFFVRYVEMLEISQISDSSTFLRR